MLCASLGTALAQTIRGIVRDTSGNAVEYALVWLTSTADSTVLAQTQSSAQGLFTLPSPAQSATLHIRCVGYSSHAQSIDTQGQDLDLGTIALSDEIAQLTAVQVVGQKQPATLVRRAGRITLDVAQSLDAQGSTALDLLGKLPGLSIDPVGKSIRFTGRDNVLILLNGKQTRMKPDELIALLRGTASSSIKTIELMTNPSVQYDAEGSGALINIVLQRSLRDGLDVLANLGASYWYHLRGNADLSASLRTGRWDVWARYSHTRGHVAYRYGNDRYQQGTLYSSHSDDVDKRNYTNASIGAEYTLTPRTKIGAEVSGNFMYGPGFVDTRSTIRHIGSAHPTSILLSYSDYQHQHANRYSLSTSLIYEPNADERLSLSADASLFDGRMHILLTNRIDANPIGIGAISAGERYQRERHTTDGGRDFDLYGVSADYYRPFLSGKLSLGAKYAQVSSVTGYYRRGVEERAGTAFDLTGTPPSALPAVALPDIASDFSYREGVSALYAQYEGALSDLWRLSLGLRAEHTHTRGQLTRPITQTQDPAITRSYLDLFPSAMLSYSPGKVGVFSLSVGRRIDRPGYALLNPIDEPLDGLSSWRGNPYLKPQKTWRTELLWQYRSTSLMASWTHTSNYFVNATDTIGAGRTAIIPMNLGAQRQFALTASQSASLGQGWQMNVSATALWQENQLAYSPTRLFNRARWGMNASAQLSAPLLWGIRGELNADYYSRRLGGSTDVAEWTGKVNVALQRSFLSDRLSLKLAMTDIFWTNRWDAVNTTEIFTIYSYGQSESRAITLNCSFRLGTSSKASSARTSSLEAEHSRL